MELEQKEGSKLAKIGQIFALKKLNLHFLKNFPRFDFTAFFCDFQCIRPIIIYWQSLWYRTGVVGGMHGWREFINIHSNFTAFDWIIWPPREYLDNLRPLNKRDGQLLQQSHHSSFCFRFHLHHLCYVRVHFCQRW